MVEPARSFLEHVGHVLFPRGPKDLTDASRCPACFVTLPASLVCPNCGLDLNHPDALLLRQESLAAASSLTSRLELIGKIRFETAAERTRILEENRSATNAAVAAAAAITQEKASRAIAAERALRESDERRRAASAAAPPLSTLAPPPPEEPALAASPAASLPPVPPVVRYEELGGSETPPARSHAGIQVILLIVGVSLLSVGAIFFLIYAFISFGLIWRSAIIAAITIASIVSATLVKRRGLAATAEALSSLAVVLVVLDIYAVRANDLLVIGDSAGRLYWGCALIIASLGFMFWHRASKLILVNVLGYAAFPPAVALLVAGVASGSSLEEFTILPMAALAGGSLIYLTAAHENYHGRIERIVTLGYAMFALIIGLATALPALLTSSEFTAGVWVLVLGAIAAVHSAAAHRAGLLPLIRNSFATASGVLIATALWNLLATGILTSDTATTVPITTFAVVALLALVAVLSESSGRNFRTEARSATFWAAIGVWTITAIALVVPFAISLRVALQYTDQSALRRTTPANAPFDLTDNGWPQLALLSIPVIMALGWWATGQLRSRINLVLASAGIALAIAAPVAGSLLAVVVTWLALATSAVAIIGNDRRRRRKLGPGHAIIAAGGVLALVLAYNSGLSSYETWLLSGIATGALLFAARYLVDTAAVRTVLLGIATLVFILTAALVGEQLQFALTISTPNPLESWITVSIFAVAVITRSLWPRTRELNEIDRRVLWWIGFLTTSLAGTNLWLASLDGAPFVSAPLALNLGLISLLVAITFVAMLSITMLSARTSIHAVERIVAAAALTPAIIWALDSASRVLGLGNIALELAPATASVLVGALSMTLRVRRQHTSVRRASEIGALTIAGITTASAILQPQQTHWLIALLVAITLLLASISVDGIFGSRSLRRQAIWAAVIFATWALWLRLDQNRVEALEAYVLPLAALVLAIAVFTARAELRETQLRSSPYIALAGLLIALVPLALNAASGTGLRTLIIAGVSGALLLAAAFVTPQQRLLAFWGITVVAAATGLVVSTTARTLYSLETSLSTSPEFDSWLLGAVALMILASFGLTTSGFTRSASLTLWARTGTILLGSALVLLFSVEALVVVNVSNADAPTNDLRIIALIALGAILVALGARVTTPPFTRQISYLAFALSAMVGLAAFSAAVISPIEWWLTSAILGLGLLIRALSARSDESSTSERRVVWWLGFTASILAGVNLWSAHLSGAVFSSSPLIFNLPLINVIGSLALLAALLFTMFGRGMRRHTVERIAAAAVLAPATVWVLDSAVRAIGLGTIAVDLAPATASILVGALSMTLRIRQQQVVIRRTAEIGALAIALLTTVGAILQPHDTRWLIALLVSITLLLATITTDGIFGTRSPRRHIIWAAVAFATWALWLRLDHNRITALEAYVLPLAALVLAIAIFTARAESRESRARSAPAIVLVGLLIAILPLALNSASGTELRTFVIAAVCAALLLLASFVELRGNLAEFRGVTLVASSLGVIAAIAARTATIIIEGRSANPELDLWLIGTVIVLALAGFGLTSTGFASDSGNPRWSMTSEALLGSAIVMLYGIEAIVLVVSGGRDLALDGIRAVALVALGGALLVAGTWLKNTPLTLRLSYLASGLATVVGIIALLSAAVHPIEWVTVVLGAALIAHGSLRLAHQAEARSMTWLAPGLLVVFLPSLVATFIDTNSPDTGWRIVALGIVGVLAILVGAWQKLKAPLLIATVIVLIHAAHTFAPALLGLYQLTSWWMWAVIGGAIVLFLGITLERRIRDLKTLNTRFSALR